MKNVTETPAAGSPKWMTIVGWVLSVIPALLLLFSGVLKFMPIPGNDENLQHIGWKAESVPTLGVIEIICTLIYLIPQTAMLGSILLAAYMGGTVATHLRVGDPFFVQILIGVVLWLGLWLREPRLRALTPIRS